MEHLSNYLSVKEAARVSGYNEEYLRRRIRQGKVTAEKLFGGWIWLVHKDSLQDYVKHMQQLGSEKFNSH